MNDGQTDTVAGKSRTAAGALPATGSIEGAGTKRARVRTPAKAATAGKATTARKAPTAAAGTLAGGKTLQPAQAVAGDVEPAWLTGMKADIERAATIGARLTGAGSKMFAHLPDQSPQAIAGYLLREAVDGLQSQMQALQLVE